MFSIMCPPITNTVRKLWFVKSGVPLYASPARSNMRPAHTTINPVFNLQRPSRPHRRRIPPAYASGKPSESGEQSSDEPKFGLDKLDPVSLGRRSRQAFDDVWAQFAKLTAPTSSFSEAELGVFADAGFDYETPQAECTTVLVVGATGTVGKILVRKLLLRGYRVQVLVRNKKGVEAELPPAVKVVEGDVCDMKTCKEAVSGVDKVIYAAAARNRSAKEFQHVEDKGVGAMIRALQDYRNKKYRQRGGLSPNAKKNVADFKIEKTVDTFTVQELGEESRLSMQMNVLDGDRLWAKGLDFARLSLSENRHLCFEGEVLMPEAVAEAGRPLQEGENFSQYEGVIMRILGDGHLYAVCLTSGKTGTRYLSIFPTRAGYMTVRLPFNMFRPETAGDPPLDLNDISTISVCFKNTGRQISGSKPPGSFRIEVDWIKLLPSGQESDVILMSCAGQSRPNMSEKELESLIRAKRTGEARLRNSGLGYTIVRATHLLSEPGGYKALVFDQGDRLSKGISAADAADVCVRSLHQPLARNKTFEVSEEITPEGGLEMYELVAHVPDKSTNYLGAALQNLEKNT